MPAEARSPAAGHPAGQSSCHHPAGHHPHHPHHPQHPHSAAPATLAQSAFAQPRRVTYDPSAAAPSRGARPGAGTRPTVADAREAGPLTPVGAHRLTMLDAHVDRLLRVVECYPCRHEWRVDLRREVCDACSRRHVVIYGCTKCVTKLCKNCLARRE